jgi:hypothetical protein
MMKVEFASPLRAEHISGTTWKLLEPFLFTVELAGGKAYYMVPAGFVTDGASVPRWPGMYWLFGGKATKSACAHDWLYSEVNSEREYADEVFYAAMRNEERAWRRGVMWLGVRLGGWLPWYKRKGEVDGYARAEELANVQPGRPGDFPPDGVQGP